MRNKKNNKGFTLVELLVVIAIIGILAVVAVPALFKNIEKGKIADLEADISSIRSAALSYYSDNSEYPVDSTEDNNNVLTSNDKLENELEGLSNPFKASEYTLSGTAPGLLQLTIKLPSGSELSEDGFLKLQKDLGSDVVPNNKIEYKQGAEPISGNEETGYKDVNENKVDKDGYLLDEDGNKIPKGLGNSYEKGDPIVINLINN